MGRHPGLHMAFRAPPFQKSIFSALESDPLFARPGRGLPVDKLRELTFLRCRRVFQLDCLRADTLLQSPPRLLALVTCLGMYDWSLATKAFLHAFVSRRAERGAARWPGARATRDARRRNWAAACGVSTPAWVVGCQCLLASKVSWDLGTRGALA